jgi:hypothetical protein
MIDALFGSKTRVKLLHLFYNNPGKAYFVREITRVIDEQINSVRRELANMMKIGVVISNNVDNKLYYEVNPQYEYYTPLSQIFSDTPQPHKVAIPVLSWQDTLVRTLPTSMLIVASGALSGSTHTDVDLLIVGPVAPIKLKNFIREFESGENRTLNYTAMPMQEFYYRWSIRDKFITDILAEPRMVLKDSENIIR